VRGTVAPAGAAEPPAAAEKPAKFDFETCAFDLVK
jgi:hypothetical protein